MYKYERLSLIFNELMKHKKVTVIGLSVLMKVSKETIRTDLRYLEKKQLVKRFHGGALLNMEFTFDEHLSSPNGIFHVSSLMDSKQSENNYFEEKIVMSPNKVCVLGSFNVDIISTLKRFPRQGETVVSENCIIGPGGKGSNQALAASRSNSSVYFMTKVGNDQFKDFAENHLKKSGIKKFSLLVSESHATGSAAIFVSKAEKDNQIAIYPGANTTLTEEEVLILRSQLESGTIFLTQCETNYSAIRQGINLARDEGAYVILNPAPYCDFVLDLINDIDLLTPNQSEAAEICGFPVNDLKSAAEAIDAIKSRGVKDVLITLGGDGVIFSNGHKKTYIPPFKSVVTDTTGAGDAFNGAMAARMANGVDITNAALFASAFASLAIEKEGAGNMPTEQQALERIKSQNNVKPVVLTENVIASLSASAVATYNAE